MITGWRFARSVGIMFLCIGSLQPAYATGTNRHKKKVQPQLPSLPSGPTGPLQPIPLDSMAPVEPRVTYQNGQLTIFAPNSTLEDVLRAVRKQTGAQIEVPDATERVVTHLGPGPLKEIMAKLLNGSRFNYVLLWSPQDPSVLTRVLLVAQSLVAQSAETANAAAPSQPPTAVDVQASPDEPTAARNASSDPKSEVPGQPDQPVVSGQSGMTPQKLQLLMEQNERQHLQQQARGEPVPEPSFPSAPEIDGATGLAPLALLASTILIIRGRRER